MMSTQKNLGKLFVVALLTSILAACGEGGDGGSSPSGTPSSSIIPPDSSGTPTTLVTAANGVSSVVCAKNAQCLSQLFHAAANVANNMTIAATPWTNTTTNIITIDKTAFVDGEVTAAQIDPAGSVFSMSTDDKYRYLKGNGLPTTPMGNFPVQPGTAAYPYYSPLPGGTDPRSGQAYSSAAAISISPYDITSTLPLNPVMTGFNPINSLIVGITLTGAVWHVEYANDSSGNWYSPANAVPTDKCFGHPYSQQYHYHAYSWRCFPNQGTSGHSPLFGYALDGFGIYGPRGDDGLMVTNAQLDECHGHVHPVMWNGTIQPIYHYHLNREFPYSVGCFRGTPDYNKALGSAAMQQGIPYSQLPDLSGAIVPPGFTDPQLAGGFR